ncbi:MAG: hypothetical protein WDW36_001391 [Sanguina aurantia]
MGDTYQPHSSRPKGPIVLSWDPRVFLYRGFLSDEECDHVQSKAKPRLYRSGVADATTGASTYSDIRTSSGMFFNRFEDDVVRDVEERLAAWTLLSAENGEGIQVLHYEDGQKYDPHHDYFSFAAGDDNGGNRCATVLMYLSDVEEGGETVFPKVPVPKNQTSAHFSPCAMKGLAVHPRKGDALLFWSIRPDGTFDPKSLHGSCPVLKGVKWSATKWIHIGRYATLGEAEVKVVRVKHVPPSPPPTPGCIDRHQLCSHWAESGECTDNAGYMVGTAGAPGDCIMSCHRCDLGPNDPKWTPASSSKPATVK